MSFWYLVSERAPKWNKFADLDGNGIINMRDIVLIVLKRARRVEASSLIGFPCPSYQAESTLNPLGKFSIWPSSCAICFSMQATGEGALSCKLAHATVEGPVQDHSCVANIGARISMQEVMKKWGA